MNFLVGDLTLDYEKKPRVKLIFENGHIENATYCDTSGYNHLFLLDNGKTLRLSNYFMHLKGIRVKLLPPEEQKSEEQNP